MLKKKENNTDKIQIKIKSFGQNTPLGLHLLGRESVNICKNLPDHIQEYSEAVMLMDDQLKVIGINEAAASQVGKKAVEIIGKNLSFFIHPAFLPEGLDKISQAIQTGEPVVIQASNNGYSSLHSTYPIFNAKGKLARTIIISRDITGSLKIKNALDESENNFKALAENANDGIVIAGGKNGIHQYVNQRFCNIIGYSKAELMKIGFKELTPSNRTNEMGEKYQRSLSGKILPLNYETELLRKDGKIVPIEITGGQTIWRGKQAAIVIVRDITERKVIEKELITYRNHLEGLVDERIFEIKKTNKKLEEEVIKHKKTAQKLKQHENELQKKSKKLEELNTALTVILNKGDEDRKKIEKDVMSNIKELLIPYLEKLKAGPLGKRQGEYIKIIEKCIENIISPFSSNSSYSFLNFTPAETKVANLITQGKQTKEIAQLMCLSARTIESHRKNIRKKMKLTHKKANLKACLMDIC